MLAGANAQGLEVDAALVVKYPVQGVSNLRAKVVASATFKFRGSAGRTAQKGDRKGVSLVACGAEAQALSRVPRGALGGKPTWQGCTCPSSSVQTQAMSQARTVPGCAAVCGGSAH